MANFTCILLCLGLSVRYTCGLLVFFSCMDTNNVAFEFSPYLLPIVVHDFFLLISITLEGCGASQMTLHLSLSNLSCFQLPQLSWQSPFLSTLQYCLSISSSWYLFFFFPFVSGPLRSKGVFMRYPRCASTWACAWSKCSVSVLRSVSQ